MVQSKGSSSVVHGRRLLAGAFVLGLFLSVLGGCSSSNKKEAEVAQGEKKNVRLSIQDKKKDTKTDQETVKVPKQRVAIWKLDGVTQVATYEGPVPEKKDADSTFSGKTIVAVAVGGNNWFATASADGSVRVYNADAKDQDINIGGTTPLGFGAKGAYLVCGAELAEGLCLAMSPDGKLMALGHAGVVLVETETGKKLSQLKDAKETVQALHFTPDGKRLLAAAGSDLILWDVADANSPKHLSTTAMPSHREKGGAIIPELAVVAFTPDGKMLGAPLERLPLVAYGDSDAKKIEYKTYKVDKAVASPFTALAFSPDGKHLVAAHMDGKLRVWETATAKMLTVIATEKTVTPTSRSIAFSPDGAWLVVGYTDGTMQRWPSSQALPK